MSLLNCYVTLIFIKKVLYFQYPKLKDKFPFGPNSALNFVFKINKACSFVLCRAFFFKDVSVYKLRVVFVVIHENLKNRY